MAKKHPSSEQIQAMLQEGHFGAERELPRADPVTVTQLVVEIDRIQPYDHNPRRERNPQYDEIKESIRAQGGLNNPLTVTRRPGGTCYMVESGGNTRLQILKELWQETEDNRFYRIHCLFRPWVSESHVLTAHLIENDKRGELTFIDKALGVRELRDVMESERNATFSQRQLVEALRERGYGLDQSTISRMDYAVDVLLPIIPEALRSGMGAPQIRRIRRLETACRNFWCDHGEISERFDALFNEALADNDGPHWDLDAAQGELETRMAETTGLSLKQVRLEIDARLATGDKESSPSVMTRTEDHPSLATVPTPDAPPVVTAPTVGESAASDSSTSSSVADTGSDAASRESNDSPATTAGLALDSPTTEVSASAYDGPSDLKSLRSRCYVLALKLAKRHDLEDCITPAGQLGLGFLVDIPRESIIPIAGQADALPQLYRQWVWWLLLSLSEETVQPERMEQVPDDLLLRNLILEQNDTQALALVGEPDWKVLGYEWLNNPAVPQPTIDDLLALTQTCRRIRQQMHDDGGLTLWQGHG